MWCWWCCHSFKGESLQLPIKHDERRNTFETLGHFCSWSCMKSYTLDQYGLNRGGLICGNIVMMRRKKFKTIGSIKMAPNRFRLQVFGGDLSIEEFRQNQTQDTTTPNVIETKPHADIVIPIISNTTKMNEIKNATLDNHGLKLKRSKPLKRNHNNLESALGLIITSKT
jgi:hypothetical protein